MCGIFGYIGKIEREKAKACLDTLAHRGPDGWGLWQDEGVTLGHRRLAILDLSENGKQPMSFANERYWITFNGEIYNFVEIRKELEGLGHSFRSSSDTEVILAAYHQWEEKCLEKFNGMWAFAIWDKKEKQLFFSRDRLGKKPFFYYFTDKVFAFASEMKALTPVLPKVEPNRELLADTKHIFYYESTDQCLVRDLKRLPAGHYGVWKSGRINLYRYWNTLDHLVEVPKTYEEQVEAFRPLFLDACRLRMRSDVKVGTALSGGLDSSSTISAMAHIDRQNPCERVSQDWQHAFVASFPGTPLDETAYAKKVVDHLGIQATYLNIDAGKAINKLNEYLYLFEDIYHTSPLPFMLLYKAEKDNGVTVTLDGHGADELFGGYGSDVLHLLHDTWLRPKESLSVIETFYSSNLQDGVQFRRLPPKALFYLQMWLKNGMKKAIGYENVSRDQSHPKWKEFTYFAQKLYIATHETVLPTLLRNYDRYSMASGVEIRMPFLDHRIVSFAFSLPWQSKIRGGYTKKIVRDAMAPFVPKEVAYRKSKIGFNSPVVDWAKGPMKDFFLDTINSLAFKNSAFVDQAKVRKLVENLVFDPKASFQTGTEAWVGLSPFLWEQAFYNKVKK